MATLRRHNRRPPKDPSAAYRPKNALEKQAMQAHAFRQKVQAANSITICNAGSAKVGRLPLRTLLASDKFCVPIFQRRYCWTATQWQTLLEDAQAYAKGGQQQHSLGRLTCTNSGSSGSNANANAAKKTPHQKNNNSLAGMILEGRSCILDGQQRYTTVTILLAAIRDLLEEAKEPSNATTVHLIHNLIFTNPIQLKAWLYKPDTKLEEGMELDFCRLIPTYCDRYSYYQAILPKSEKTLPTDTNNAYSSSSSWNRPLQAKSYFIAQLQECSTQQLTALVHAILDGLTMLYFPVDMDQGRDDGTEDLMVIYERLALRDATFCKPTRGNEYQSMDGADMIRNLLLGCLETQQEALEFYKTYWLPLEQQAEQRDVTIGTLIQSFLLVEPQQKNQKQQSATNEEEKEEGEEPAVQKGIIGGQIYADFQAWFNARLPIPPQGEEEEGENQKEDDAMKKQERVKQQNELVQTVGQELLEYSRSYKE